MKNNFFERRKHSTLLLFLFFFSYFILMFGNGIISLTHPDEVFYTQSAKEMLERHSWFTPYIFDEIQFEKPFLAFALFVMGIKWFGLTPFVARFWPAFFGIIGVGITYWIAWMLFKSKRLAFFAGVILCTSFIYLSLARAVLTDMIFTVIIAASIGFFVFGYWYPQYKNRGIILWLCFSAFAVLTKGLLGVCFPVSIALFYLFYNKDLKFLLCKATVCGLFFFIGITLPWHMVMYQNHGQFFLDEYFKNVHFRRLFEAEHLRLNRWYFYPAVMFFGFMPWFLFWIPAIKMIVRNLKYNFPERKNIALLLFWIIGTYIFVQPAASKLASYIFPAFPAVAMILAFYVHQAVMNVERGKNAIGLRWCGYGMVIFLAFIVISAVSACSILSHFIPDRMPIYLCAALLAFFAVLIFIFNVKKQYVRMVLSHAGMTISVLILLYTAKPYIEPWVSCKMISLKFNAMDQSDTPVLASKFYVRGVKFYTGRDMVVMDINGKGFFSPHPIPFFKTDWEVLQFLKQRPRTYAIVKEGDVLDLQRILRGQAFSMRQMETIGGKYIIKIDKIEKNIL